MTQRVAFVTGAMGGLGTAICHAFVKDGYKVVAAYHPQFDNKDEWLKEQVAAGYKDFVCVAGDVSKIEDCQAMAAEAEAKAGPVDILVNNAGITRDGLVLRMKRAAWDDVLSTNLTGAFLLTQTLLSPMLRNRWGRIVNITSVVGETGQAGQVNYAASKAGLIGMTRALAREVGSRGITVNAVAPGYIETPMTAVLDQKQREAMLAGIPLGRAGTDAEVAQCVAFLASEAAAYITGHVLDVNGGMFMG